MGITKLIASGNPSVIDPIQSQLTLLDLSRYRIIRLSIGNWAFSPAPLLIGTADNVVGLVYISGFAPDEGENLTDLQSRFPAPGAVPYFRQHRLPEGGNEFTLAPEGFHESFCADLPADDAAFYAITQRPLAGVALTEAAPTPAWRSRPAWAVFGTADRCIDPGVHGFSYERMSATVTMIEGASHVVMISPPGK
jgi:hypothetical protein